MVDCRVAGKPLEHILGWAEFCGLRIAVEAGVFVPRRRTEFLVRQALDQAGGRPGEVVVDLCCGSGAVAAALLAALPDAEVHAADIEPTAVRCARRNIIAGGGLVHEGDLFAALPRALRGRVDLLVVNAPYVPTDAIGLMPPEARDHEPRLALDGGTDGLDVLSRVIIGAPSWLAPRGRLLFETSAEQAPSLVDAVARTGLIPRVAVSDESAATVVIAVPRDGDPPTSDRQ
jgi:release factor glutamine methyltransferase